MAALRTDWVGEEDLGVLRVQGCVELYGFFILRHSPYELIDDAPDPYQSPRVRTSPHISLRVRRACRKVEVWTFEMCHIG